MKRGLIYGLLVLMGAPLVAQVTEWQGPDRSAVFSDTGLLTHWPAEGPDLLFVTEGLGKGFSSVVSRGDTTYATGVIDSLEVLSAVDATGRILWQTSYGPAWKGTYPEARCTPTLEENRLYVLTGMDRLSCRRTTDGSEIWSVDLHAEYGSEWDMFGVSESPLLYKDWVIATPAGKETTVVALDKRTGKTVWKSPSLDAKRSNLSPRWIHHCGRDYILTAVQTHMIGVDAATGDILWTHLHNVLDQNNDNSTILANTPVYHDSCVWISNGWEVPSVMLEISPDGKHVTEKFSDRTFDNQNHGVVLVDGHLYGSNFTGRQTGKWVCMNWDTGEIKWIGDFHTKGPVISADGMLYLLEEKRGNMALVKADPEHFEVVSSFRIEAGAGPFWARPVICDGKLMVRHGDVLAVYALKKRNETTGTSESDHSPADRGRDRLHRLVAGARSSA
ncbi:MAG: PQQ-binding-like beta-propeller repeat protein [Bacteroidales bacterium]